ncbi:MAG: hypothetical protein LR015_00465 [Verrucomicrobia bacterium]|nr:hypothetical protein [Verrucomicrobiota bacterium]
METTQYERLVMPLIDRLLANGRSASNLFAVTTLLPAHSKHQTLLTQWQQSLTQAERTSLRNFAQAIVDNRASLTNGDPSLTPRPAQHPSWFDVDAVIRRAYSGDTGAMIDLMYALNNSWGIARDGRAAGYWYRKAGSQFIFPEGATREQIAAVNQLMAEAGSMVGEYNVLTNNRISPDQPGRDAWLQSMLALAWRGYHQAVDESFSQWRFHGLPLTMPEVRALIENYLPDNRGAFLGRKTTLIREGHFGEPINWYVLRRDLEALDPISQRDRLAGAMLADMLSLGLGGEVDAGRAAELYSMDSQQRQQRHVAKSSLPDVVSTTSLRQRAMAKDPVAKFDLGAIYRVGTGIWRNYSMGLRLEREWKALSGSDFHPTINLQRQLEAARPLAEQGSLTARNLRAEAAARLAEASGDYEGQRALLESEAASGIFSARRALARWAYQGMGISEPDLNAARRHLLGLALEGDNWARAAIDNDWRVPDALPLSTLAQWAWEHQRDLHHRGLNGFFERLGWTDPPYLDVAARTVAAEQGDAGAMWDLAFVFNSKAFWARRAGEKENEGRFGKLAQDWHERYLLADGAEQHHFGSLEALRDYRIQQLGTLTDAHQKARNILSGNPSEADRVRAIELLRLAAERGNYASALELGRQLLDRRLVFSRLEALLTGDQVSPLSPAAEAKQWLEKILHLEIGEAYKLYAEAVSQSDSTNFRAMRKYALRAVELGEIAAALEMSGRLNRDQAGGSIEACAWLLAAARLEPELVAPHIAMQRIYAAAREGNRNAMMVWSRINRLGLSLYFIDRPAAAGWGMLARVDNGHPAPALNWAVNWLREEMSDEDWTAATNLTPERIQALGAREPTLIRRATLPWQQQLTQGQGEARRLYDQIRPFTSIGRQVNRELLASGSPFAFREE